jgi:hypothetical protein
MQVDPDNRLVADTLEADPKIVEIVDELLTDHTYPEIATILDKRGCKSGQGHRIDRNVVKRFNI